VPAWRHPSLATLKNGPPRRRLVEGSRDVEAVVVDMANVHARRGLAVWILAALAVVVVLAVVMLLLSGGGGGTGGGSSIPGY